MKIGEIGEFGLLDKLGLYKRQFANGWIGPGDDCAVIPFCNSNLSISTDLLVEDVHFRRSTASALDIGYKALAVNLSDLASMGARPLGFVMGAAFPRDLEVGWVSEMLEGLDQCGEEFGCPLVGGDTSRSDKITLSITVFGESGGKREGWNPVMRSGANPGDVVMLTGFTGESGAGLAALEKGANKSGDSTCATLLLRHLRPTPRIIFGVALAQSELATSMIDLSDGMILDATHIANRSGVGIVLDSERVSLSEALRAGCEGLGLNPLELALTGGEDYELLFTVHPGAVERVIALGERHELRVTAIGEVKNGSEVEVTGAGAKYIKNSKGYDHFKGGG